MAEQFVGQNVTGVRKLEKSLFVILNGSEESCTIEKSPLYLFALMSQVEDFSLC